MPSLQNYHSFHLNAQAQQLETFHDVPSALSLCRQYPQHYLLGEGSNTVFIEDYDGAVLLNRITGIEVSTSATAVNLRVGAGENWHNLVTTALAQDWHGMENLALIPGAVGASPIQNIGAYGLGVADWFYLDLFYGRFAGPLINCFGACLFAGLASELFSQSWF